MIVVLLVSISIAGFVATEIARMLKAANDFEVLGLPVAPALFNINGGERYPAPHTTATPPRPPARAVEIGFCGMRVPTHDLAGKST